MLPLILVFPVTPIGKGRPRFRRLRTRAGVITKAVTPAATRKAEADLALLARQLYDDPPLLGPLRVKIAFTFKKETGPRATPYPVTWDLDNLGKLVLDALNGIVWPDDRHIVSLELTKRYCAVDSVSVEVWGTMGR